MGKPADAADNGQGAPSRWRLSQLAPFLLFGVMLLARCGPRATTQAAGRPGDVQHISMEMSASELAPVIVTVRASHPVDVTVRNTGVVARNWAVEGLDQPVHLTLEP